MPTSDSRFVEIAAPRVAYVYLRLLRATMRLEYRNREALDRAREASGNYILAFWHSRFVMMPYAYPDSRLVVLHSQHRDARLVASIMARFGLAQAWGSSTRGGASGMRTILRRIREGYDVGITPDGPRGPRREAQPGVIALARLGKIPIVPVSFSARPFRRLGTWDGTLLPYPFARGVYRYGEPIHVPRDADESEQEAWRRRVTDELDRLTDRVDDEAGIPAEPPRTPAEAS